MRRSSLLIGGGATTQARTAMVRRTRVIPSGPFSLTTSTSTRLLSTALLLPSSALWARCMRHHLPSLSPSMVSSSPMICRSFGVAIPRLVPRKQFTPPSPSQSQSQSSSSAPSTEEISPSDEPSVKASEKYLRPPSREVLHHSANDPHHYMTCTT
jgi:hypothetical protein